MDAEKIKDIARTAIIEAVSQGERVSRAYVLGIVEGVWATAERAEQEEWKDLPLCSEERGEEVARAIDPCPWYNYWLCAYHRCQEGDIIFHRCALPIDEDTYDEAYYEGLFKFWKKQAEIYMRENIHLKKRPQDTAFSAGLDAYLRNSVRFMARYSRWREEHEAGKS